MWLSLRITKKEVTAMQLGKWELPAYAMLAPMAGVSDRALRELCRRFGAVATVGEMVSSKGLVQGSRKSAALMQIGEREMPSAIQLFGDEPEAMARAAALAQEYHPAWLDINMGCPAPKIAGNRSGSALMRDPERAAAILRAVKAESSLPVTVKFRKGWDDAHVNAVEFAIMAEQSGADAITVHGRTREQMYAPPVDWEIIRRVKEAVSIPVIGNGDVVSPETAKALYDATGCDLVMIGRGALGAPWLFRQVQQYLATEHYDPAPPLSERMALMVEQMTLAVQYKGEGVASREARKHCGWYISGIRGAAQLRRAAGELQTLEDVKRLAERVLKEAGED